MIKNFRNSFAATLVLAAAAVPGAAYARTAIANGSSTMSIAPNCSVAGATVDLGTYRTNQTVADVANYLGYWGADGYLVQGTLAPGAMMLGSITCDNGMPYTIMIEGTGTTLWNTFEIPLAGKTLRGTIRAMKIGDQVLPWGIWGWMVDSSEAPATGTGTAQEIRGNIYPNFGDFSFFPSTKPYAVLTDKLASPGTNSGSLRYTLNF